MICGRGSDSHTISFYGRKAKILKEEEKLYDLKFYKQRVNSCPFFFKWALRLDSNIIPMILKKKSTSKQMSKMHSGKCFFKTTLTNFKSMLFDIKENEYVQKSRWMTS